MVEKGILPLELFLLVILLSPEVMVPALAVESADKGGGRAAASSLDIWVEAGLSDRLLSRPSISSCPGSVPRMVEPPGVGLPGAGADRMGALGLSEKTEGEREPLDVARVAVESERGRPDLPTTSWI